MIYNDFPILRDSTYNTLQQQFKNQQKDRRIYASEIYATTCDCISLCNTIKNLNHLITSQLNETKLNLLQIKENLLANFNVDKSKNTQTIQFNIFQLIKKLLLIINKSICWLREEDKEYYKTFIKNLNLSVIFILNNILSSLEKSNIILFKHM